MKKVIILSLVLAAGFLSFSCEKETWNALTIEGRGEVITQSLKLESFTRIRLDGVANLHIAKGDAQSVVLKAQQNIMEVLTWEVSAETLIIGLKDGLTLENHEEIRFEIQLPALTSLVHDGVGDYHLKGEVSEELDIDFRGVGHIYAYAWPVNHCLILHSGIGDCYVNIFKGLEVDLSAPGNVYYRGNPQINCTDNGLGELINDN
jgi:hypothetical protein